MVRLYYSLLRGCGTGKADGAHLVNKGRLIACGLDVLVFMPVRLLFGSLLPDAEGGSEVAFAATESGGVETH